MTSRRLASDCNRESIVVALTAPHISQSLCRTASLHNHHANGVGNAQNLRGQSRPWNQQNWSQGNNTQNPPYWPAPARSRPPHQNWSQNNTWYPQGTWPVTTQAQTQQKIQYKNGVRPVRNTSAVRITSAGSSQNQGHIGKPSGQINGVRPAAPISQSQRGQMWRPRPS